MYLYFSSVVDSMLEAREDMAREDMGQLVKTVKVPCDVNLLFFFSRLLIHETD